MFITDGHNEGGDKWSIEQAKYGSNQIYLGMGGVLGQGKGSGSWVNKRFMEILMSQLCWQHAKIISPNKNPPERSKGVINVNS